MKNNHVTVGLIGGIGNQLFQYYAGLYLANKNRTELILDFSKLGKAGTSHAGSIKDLDLACVSQEYEPNGTKLAEIRWRLHQKLSRQFPSTRKLSIGLLGLYQSNVIGFDFELDKLESPIVIRGYFQTWRYFHEAKLINDSPIGLLSPSSWYQSQLADIERLEPVGIHIRRGDYKNLGETFGMLSTEYYSRALSKLGSVCTGNGIYVFSDDINQAKKLLSGLNYDFHFVQPPEGSSPAESLLLMSKCSSLVIANSSFSWWGGMLGSDSRTVIAPDKWFRGLDDPEDLLPISWLKERSSWESA